MKEYSEEFKQLQEDYKDIDRQYKNVKKDIEISRSPEEQNYWMSRADDLWHQRDELGYKIDTYDQGEDVSVGLLDSDDFNSEESATDNELDNDENDDEESS